jgi:ribosomal protein S18 acetylase RimI-like enzyme
MIPITDITAINLICANQYSIKELVNIYNQTRVDYMVPMPMNAARLEEYITTYDVKLEHSLVAKLPNGEMLGVIMLGVRSGRIWITRLGVIPNTRRLGIGKTLVKASLEKAKQLSINFCMLEVINNNIPAHQLFIKFGFQEVGELLVLRRPPFVKNNSLSTANVQFLDRAQVLELIKQNLLMPAWTNQYETYSNATEISGLQVTLEDGSQGWMAFQRQKFMLSRFVIKTEKGDSVKVGQALLRQLHYQYPSLDTQVENIQSTDPHLPAFYESGYIESFRRVEMRLGEPT